MCLIIEDTEFDTGVMNGKNARVGRFAGAFRRFLFKEHLGLLDEDQNKADETVKDPVSEDFYQNVWSVISFL